MIAVLERPTAAQVKGAVDQLERGFNPEEAQRMLDQLEDGLPYTQTPNIVIDRLFKILTDLEKAILLYVIRRTKGFHKKQARVSTSQMMRDVNKGRTAVNNARRALIDKGYLVVVERGTGLRATLYKVCLHPEIREQIQAHAEALEGNVENPVENSEDSHRAAGFEFGWEAEGAQQVTGDLTDAPATGQEPMTDPSVTLHTPPVTPPECPHTTDQPCPLPTGAADPLPPTPQPPQDSASSEKSSPEASKIKGDGIATPSDNRGVYTGTPKKTDTGAKVDTKQDKKNAYACVRSLLRYLKTKLADKDFAFLWWCINTYGAAKVTEKANIMRFQVRRGIAFTKPLAWLRDALRYDWDYAKKDLQKIRGDERAKREIERSNREREAWEKHCHTVEAEQSDPETQARIKALLAETNAKLGISLD